MRVCRCPVLLLLPFLAGNILVAQSASTGALGGVVTDPAGAAVPGASVDLTDAAFGTHRTLHTDAMGEFLLGDLPPGRYRLAFSAAGFDRLVVNEADVEVGVTVRMAPHLRVAPIQQTVEVRALESLPDFESPVNANLSPEELADLPMDGRRFQSLAVLTPLVSEDDASQPADGSGEAGASPAGDSDQVRLAVRGMNPMHNSYRLDGLSLSRAFDGEPRGGQVLPFTVAREGVREFQVRAVGAARELGRDAGGSVNTVTRRGEARLHGSAFLLVRNSAVGASNPFSVATRYNGGSPTFQQVKPRDQREQFGGSAGGPLFHVGDGFRLFGFLAAEGQRRSFPLLSSPSNSNFYLLSPVQKALLANRGVGSVAIDKALTFLDGLTGEVPREANEAAFLPRIDVQFGQRSALALEWARVRFQSPSGWSSAPVVALGRASIQDVATHTDSVLMHLSTALSGRWLSQTGAQWSRDAAFAEIPPPLPSEPQSGPGGTVPRVVLGGSFAFGNAETAGARRLPEEHRVEVNEQIIFSGAAHTVVLGADASVIDERIGSRDASSGNYSYTERTSAGRAGALVDFITDYTFSATAYPNGGCPSIFATVHLFCFSSFTQSFGSIAETRFHTGEWTAFAADSWRPTPRLRITAGARYEYNRLPPPQHPNPALDAALAAALATAPGSDFASTSTVPSDTNNLAPHLAIAYAPAPRTVVRIRYGVHFGRVPGRMLQAALENTALLSSQVTLRIAPNAVIDPKCASVGTNFGYPATYVCSPFGPGPSANAAMVFARGFQAPMVQTADVSITHELGRVAQVSATYVMGLNRQLANTTDLNVAPASDTVAFRIVRKGGEPGARGGDVYHVPLYTARRTQSYGPVTGILSNGTGTYHAMVLELERRSSHGLAGRVAWTYAKAIDTVRTTGPAPNQDAQFDPFDPLYDRAASNFDRRHRVVGSLVWRPVFHPHQEWMRRLENGWSAAGLFHVASGRPYSYNISGGTNLLGGRETLNGSGGATYLPTVGRNTLRLPWTEEVDLRVSRAVELSDRVHLRLSAEAFNLLNHVNVTAAEQTAFLVGTADANGIYPLTFQDATAIAGEGIAATPFGTPTSSANSPARERRLQAGLRMEW